MKKIPVLHLTALFVFLTLLCFTSAGCSRLDHLKEDIAQQFVSSEEDTEENQVKERVYMDEIAGTLQGFDGNYIKIETYDHASYTFNINQASIECTDGLLGGDAISLVYEGQLNNSQGDPVTVVKVVDDYDHSEVFEDRCAYVKVTGMTANTLSVQNEAGKTAVYPITGAAQFFRSGIKSGTWVYLHFKGKFTGYLSEDETVLDASRLNVTSISDTDPFVVPEASPTPSPTPIPDTAENQEALESATTGTSQMTAAISGISLNSLGLILDNGTVLSLDISNAYCYFPGGITKGARITITYSGTFNGSTSDGINVIYATSENPASVKNSRIGTYVSGEIIGRSANTITVLSEDVCYVTFYTAEASNESSGSLQIGDAVKVYFNPLDSQESNIFHAIKVEDI